MNKVERQARHAYIAKRLRAEVTKQTSNATLWVKILHDFMQRHAKPAPERRGIDILIDLNNGGPPPHGEPWLNLIAIKKGSRKAIHATKLARRLTRLAERHERKARSHD